MHVAGPQIYQINRQTNGFQNMCDMLNATIDLKIGYFGVHESGLPDFGRTWTPNSWHQVNFWGTPENFGV